MSKSLRTMTYFIFGYTCIEGLIINITYPSTLAYVIKDVIIALIYLGLITENPGTSGSLAKIRGSLFVFGAVTIFFLLMPTRVSLLSAAVALKQRLFYIPLMYVGYWFVRDERDLYRLVWWMAWTAIPTSLFGIYLYFAGPQALLAMGASYSAIFYSTAGASGINFWRVPGTFTSPGSFALYLMVQAIAITGLLFTRGVKGRDRLFGISALIIVLGAMLVSGSRTPLLLYVMCVGIALVYLGRLTRVGTAAVGLYSALTIGFSYFGAGVRDRVGSIMSYENVQRFQDTYFGQMFLPHLLVDPMGLGLGVATIGARHFTEWNNVMLVESYFAIISYEMGVIGFLAWSWVVVKLSLLILVSRRAVVTAPFRPLWAMLALLLLLIISLMTVNTTIDSAPGNMYFWFFVGVIVRLSDYWRIQTWRHVVAPAAQPAVGAYAAGPAR